MECEEFILPDWSPPNDPAMPCRPKAGYGLVVMMMMMILMEIVMMRMVMAVALKIIEKQPCAGLLPTIRKYVTLCKTGIDDDI